jgi:putative transposon-encoded protein
MRIEGSRFGKWVHHEWPLGTDIVIIGTCTGPSGIVSRQLCLPHQVYAAKLQDMVREFGASAVVLIPAKSGDYLMLTPGDVEAMQSQPELVSR